MSLSAFEQNYWNLVGDILSNGKSTEGRNGKTLRLIGTQLKFDVRDNKFPILQMRHYPYEGVIGEFAAFCKEPKSIKDFEEFGCNYWKKWADEDGKLRVDYGNAWFNFNGANQIEWLRNEIKTNPNSRRLIISSWNPTNVISANLSLPCCHHTYQFIIDGDEMHMIWIQRSADTMLGIPADAILAALFLITLANETGYKPAEITMQFADTHIYEEHIVKATELYQLSDSAFFEMHPTYELNTFKGTAFDMFIPADISIGYGTDLPKVSSELKE
jgi:thymidylate synthase